MGLLEGLVMPAPPPALGLKDAVWLVRSDSKEAWYVEVDEAVQIVLKDYVRACGAVMGVDLLDDARVFHVTLSNAGGGDVRASVGPSGSTRPGW